MNGYAFARGKEALEKPPGMGGSSRTEQKEPCEVGSGDGRVRQVALQSKIDVARG